MVSPPHCYTLETEFGTLLTLKQQHRFGLPTPAPSEQVIVEWSAHDTLVM
jgi:hypothetical protein